MSVNRRGQGAHMSRKPLRQEQVPRRPVYVRDRRVAQRVEWIEAVESSPQLPTAESELDAAL